MVRPAPLSSLSLIRSNDDTTKIMAANGDIVGRTERCINLLKGGIYYAAVNGDGQNIDVTYIGPGENPFTLC